MVEHEIFSVVGTPWSSILLTERGMSLARARGSGAKKKGRLSPPLAIR
jgi:hypothetical protein